MFFINKQNPENRGKGYCYFWVTAWPNQLKLYMQVRMNLSDKDLKKIVRFARLVILFRSPSSKPVLLVPQSDFVQGISERFR